MKIKFALLAVYISLSLNTFAQNESVDTIKARQLDEVLVTATHQLTRIDGDGMLTTVQGTILQNLGMAKDVLAYIPGVLNNNGSIEVIGKGTPVFYINGRRMRNPYELEQMKSQQIKSVKVITNPGARYDSGTNAVIRITTVKTPGDGFALDTRTNLGVRDYGYGSELLNLNYRTGGLDVFSSLHYDYKKAKGSSTNVQNTWGQSRNQTELSMTAKTREQTFDGQIGFNFTTGSAHSFGAYYQAMSNPGRSHGKTHSSFTTDDLTPSLNMLEEDSKNERYQHIVDTYYSGSFGRWTTDATFDLLWKNNRANRTVDNMEAGADNGPMKYIDRNKGRMFAGEINMSRPLWKGSLAIGATYTDSRRTDDFSTFNSPISGNDDEIRESNVGFYAELSQNIGRLMLRAGLRYEHIKSDYYEQERIIEEQSKRYNEFLPSLNLVLPIKNAVLQLGYSRRYVRPLYAQLRSTVTYYNEFLYETGNPNLKSSFTDNLSLNLKYKWLIFMANYKLMTDRIITVCESYKGDPAVTLLKKVNSPDAIHGYEAIISIAPGVIGRSYYPVIMGGITGQSYKVNYNGRTINMNSPIGIIRFNNIVRLPDNYMLTANFSWRGKGDGENVRLGRTWQIDLSASKTFNSHWDMKLSFIDIFNTARKTTFTIYSDIRDVHTEKHNNLRSIELTVGYRFNVSRSKYKGKGAGNAEKERL